jgi:hypothetical protein
MITRDLHGYIRSEAIRGVNHVVSHIRMRGIPEDAEFITGSGPISDTVMETLTAYGLSPHRKMGNSGVICCFVE